MSKRKEFRSDLSMNRLLERLDAEVRDEIRFYLEERARAFVDEGMEPGEAWKASLDAFGDVGRIEAEVRGWAKTRESKRRGWEMLSSLMQDLRYTVRTLLAKPGFTVVALITLAWGIGANTAIFSLVHATLFRAPPVHEPDQLAAVFTTSRRGFPRSSSSYPDYLDYRDRSTHFADMAATSFLPASLGDDSGGAVFVTLQAVTGNYFELLGVTPASGRLLQPQDDVLRAGAAVAVLRHDYWKDHFLSDPEIVGQTIRLNSAAFEVVGVARPGFKGMRLDAEPEIWIPLQSGALLGVGTISQETIWERRGSRWMDMLLARLNPESTVEQARAELLAVSDQLAEEDPDARGPRSVTVDALPGYLLPNGSEAQMRGFVWLLMGVTGFTLLLACANLANLLLARASARKREIGVRLAIGAGRGRLVRQLLTESTVLALVGAGAGVFLADMLIKLLGNFQLPGSVTIDSLGIGLDGRLLLSALAISLATTVLFGLVPALQATRPELVHALKGDSVRDGTSQSDRLRKGLITLQVATCCVLLVGSGLFVRTLRQGLDVNLGVDTEGVALARFSLGLLQYEPNDAMAFTEELLARARRLPGVDAASISTRVPLQNGGALGRFAEIDGYERAEDEELRIDLVFASTGYFESLGMPLLSGRGFERADDGSGAGVVVVNQAMAGRYWPEGHAVGGTIAIGETRLQVVGVTTDATWNGLADDATNYVYTPLAQSPDEAVRRFLTLTLHTTGDADDLLPPMRAEIQGLEPELPIQTLSTMEGFLNRVLMPQRMGAALLSGFGLLALILAAVGIAGVVAFSVNQKQKDIGVRIALGASGREVLGLLVGAMARPVGLGLVVGLTAARALTGTVQSFMFRVNPTDPLVYVVMALGLAGVAALATVVPARRATRIDPVTVLKAE